MIHIFAAVFGFVGRYKLAVVWIALPWLCMSLLSWWNFPEHLPVVVGFGIVSVVIGTSTFYVIVISLAGLENKVASLLLGRLEQIHLTIETDESPDEINELLRQADEQAIKEFLEDEEQESSDSESEAK